MAQELFELKPSKVCILLDKVVNGEIGYFRIEIKIKLQTLLI